MKEVFTSLDIELNQPSGTIIQVGACVGNILTGEVIDRLNLIVYTDELIDPFIASLTGITDIDIQSLGQPRDYVLRSLKDFHELNHSFINPITWGGGDSQEIYKQFNPSDNFFGRRWIDAKTLYISYRLANGLSTQSGLSKSMNRMGLSFIGKIHNASDDAMNTFRIYVELLKRLKDK